MASLPYPGASFPASKPRNDDTAQRLLWKIAVLLSEGLGGGGVVGATAGTYASGPYAIYHAFTDTSITTVTYTDGSTQSSISLKAGDQIGGSIASIVIASGTGELYKAIV